MPTRHTHKWDGLHTRHLLESVQHTHTKAVQFLGNLAKKSERNGRNGNPRKSDSDTGKAKNKTRYLALRRTRDDAGTSTIQSQPRAQPSTHRGGTQWHTGGTSLEEASLPSRATMEEGHRVNGLGWADF